jgi:hypothetical protein
VRAQCQVLGLGRSSWYYEPVPLSERDQAMMKLLDIEYMKRPFYGVRKMTKYLRTEGYVVAKDHVRTLLRKMGLQAVFPQAQSLQASSGEPDISASITRPGRHKTQPGLVRGYNVYQIEPGFRVSGGHC